MGSIAATGQIPRKTRGISWPATQNQKKERRPLCGRLPKNQFGWNLRFLGTVLLVISIERSLQRIVDHHFALYLMVV